MTPEGPGLRKRKKQATEKALREAALRLALAQGPENVRVDDIAEAAGVSPRTYNNYFSSREQAIAAAVTAQREARVAEAVAASPAEVRLADAVVEAIVQAYTAPGEDDSTVLRLISGDSPLRTAFLDTTAAMAAPLTEVLAERLGDVEGHTARVLAAGVAAAVRIALERWLRPVGGALVVPAGPLPDLLRSTLAPLAPALDAAEAARPRR